MTPVLLDFINKCAEMEADPDTVAKMLRTSEAGPAYRKELTRLHERSVDTDAGPVYQAPLLTPEYCNQLLELAKLYNFNPNPEEEADYQIEEAMLEVVDPEVYEDVKRALLPTLNAYSLLLYSAPIGKVESIQLAKYRPEGTAGTGWHHDKVSDFTCVISLNPENFTGGGTGVRTSADTWESIAPLPKGHGLIFNGRSIQHRGLPVYSGERMLLVIWCRTEQ
jgi:hypothetical protein